MPTRIVPLDTLSQRISQQEAELEQLRQEYTARQNQLVDLTRRRDDLQDQLSQLDTEIQSITAGKTSPTPSAAAPLPAAPKPFAAKPAASTPAASTPAASTSAATSNKLISIPGAPGKGTLGEQLIEVLHESGRRMTVPELAEELIRRDFTTTSKNIPNLVADCTKKLVQRGIFRRVKGKRGVVLSKAAAVALSGTAAPTPPPTNGAQPTAPKPTAALPMEAPRRQHRGLRELITELLTRAGKPLSARELADQALAAGYQTKSKNFIGPVWTTLGKMDNVENVPGQGYTLKKRKG